jgi:hypothetical protein
MRPLYERVDGLTETVIAAAIEVHKVGTRPHVLEKTISVPRAEGAVALPIELESSRCRKIA